MGSTTFTIPGTLADAARDVEQMAEAVCIDYVWLEEPYDSPYIAH